MRRAALASLFLFACEAQGTSTPVEVVASEDRYARIDLVANREFPAAVELNGKRVCGPDARPCPSKMFGGGSSVLSLNVSRGPQAFVLYELRQASGSNFEEVRSSTFTVEIDEAGSVRCAVETGVCEAVSNASAATPAAQAAPADQCRLNSDCELGDDCRFGRCGPVCVEDRDCERGGRCAEGSDGFAVCHESGDPSEAP